LGCLHRRLVSRPHGILSDASGFTLVELVVVTTLVAILTTGAALAQHELRAALGMFQATQKLSLDLQRARVRAVAENTDHRIVFAVGSGSYRIQRQADAGYVDIGPPAQLPSMFRVVRCSAPGQTIRFRPHGNAATFGTIAVQGDNGEERRVIVNIAGRIRVER